MKKHKTEEELEAQKWSAMADLGRGDLLFFMRNILDYDWINEAEHRTLCDFMMSPTRKKYAVIAAPRGTLKSTICSQGYPLWRMVRGEHDLTVLLDSEKHDNSKVRLQGIQHKLLTSWKFRACYGDWDGRAKGYKWNDEEATVAVRTDSSIRESSFETAGIDVVKNSRHYRMIIPDDLHSEKNSQTKGQIEKVKDHIQVLQPMLEPGGEFILVCTWWDDKDANRWFLKTMGEEVSLFQETSYVDKEKTIPRYPYRLPIEELNKKKKIMKSYLFACQFLLDPVSKENALFDESDIRFISREDIPRNLRRYVLCDPAGDPTSNSEERADSDNYAIGSISVSPAGNIYLMDLAWGKFNPTEAVEEMLKMILAYNPHVSGIERTGLGNMRFHVEAELRKRGIYALVEDLRPAGRSKVLRVSELEPIIRNRKFYIAEECPHRVEILDEFVRFTRHGSKAEHDDIPDMVAYINDMTKKYGTSLDASPSVIEADIEERIQDCDERSKSVWRKWHNRSKSTLAGMGEFN